MTPLDRARLAAPAILAATAAVAAAGVAALVRAGASLCDHRLLASHAMAMPSDAMAGMPMPAPAADGVCPILLYAGLVAAALCMLALVVLLASAGRLVAAALAAFRLLVPGADTPWAPRRALVPVPAGVRLAHRRPSRAPPARA
jgi:hypothetical protein